MVSKKPGGKEGLNQDFYFWRFLLIFQNLVYTRIFRILVQTLLGEKFVWGVGGLYSEYGVGFGPTDQDLNFGFGLGPS